MAIKGKGKSKSRGVARSPRHEPVPVPVPLLRRRWVQVVAAFGLGLAVFLFAIWLTNGLRSGNQEEEAAAELLAQQQALQSWQGELEAQLGKVGTIQQGTAPAISPDVRTALQELQGGDRSSVTSEDLTSTAESLATVADDLEGFDLSGLIREKGFGPWATVILSSRTSTVEGLRAMRTAALLLTVAMEMDEGSGIL